MRKMSACASARLHARQSTSRKPSAAMQSQRYSGLPQRWPCGLPGRRAARRPPRWAGRSLSSSGTGRAGPRQSALWWAMKIGRSPIKRHAFGALRVLASAWRELAGRSTTAPIARTSMASPCVVCAPRPRSAAGSQLCATAPARSTTAGLAMGVFPARHEQRVVVQPVGPGHAAQASEVEVAAVGVVGAGVAKPAAGLACRRARRQGHDTAAKSTRALSKLPPLPASGRRRRHPASRRSTRGSSATISGLTGEGRDALVRRVARADAGLTGSTCHRRLPGLWPASRTKR